MVWAHSSYSLIDRKIETKYYEAHVQFQILDVTQTDDEILESISKKEAFIYYFTHEKVIILSTYNFVM
jgi:hypothetical protein